MTASYPSSIRPFVPRVDLVDTVIADNVNSLQEEVKALETVLGAGAQSPLASTWSGTFTQPVTWSTVYDRLANIEAGLVNGFSSAPYVYTSGGSTVTTTNNKGLVLRVGSGSINLFETYATGNVLGFNIDYTGTPKVGSANVLYVGSSEYAAILSSISTNNSTLSSGKINLSTVTAAGDIIVGSGNAAVTRLGIGTSGQYLSVSGSSLVWASALDATKIPLSTVSAAGDLILGTASGVVGRLAIGTNGQVLTSNGTTASWVSPTVYLPAVNAAVTTASTSAGVLRNVWVNTATPTSGQGIDGDIWVVYI